MEEKFILGLDQAGMEDIARVGGKNASLGEMIRHLSILGIRIPSGFIITVDAYQVFISENQLEDKITSLISEIDYQNMESLRRAGLQIRNLIRNAKFPPELSKKIIEAYYRLSAEYGQEITDVAVRSSATAEDLPDASFAGQQETYLNVRGPAAIMDSVRNCFASLFTDRAISYRQNFGYDHFAISISVCIQKMVRSDLAASGVAFSLDTESGFKDVVMIDASYGLGESIVKGLVIPDEYVVHTPTLRKGFRSIIRKIVGTKSTKMIYADGGAIKTVPVSPEDA